ncbi:hypothetical protein LNQ81_15580 [Myroides sp. M-43]|uniref:hypothetical protein n=1 Tax=Myroides oncorhynchi TaxID=2893756 RepID=UPI001E611999|nr:hypothetical protein [Myroides oncorhynchi]MCC9044096.1 hypothetical protein [Myroides oncorhynchi]
MITDNKIKYRQLYIGVFMDLVGCLSYMIPGAGEFVDLVWAPISAYILLKMYPGKVGRVGAIVNFIEELSPGFDFVPTFTITWCYTYLGKKGI